MCRYPFLIQIIETLIPDTYHYYLCGVITEISYRLEGSQSYCFFFMLLFLTKEGLCMNLIFSICCGIHVYKKTVVALIAVTNPVTFEAKYIIKSFFTMNSDIVNLHN